VPNTFKFAWKFSFCFTCASNLHFSEKIRIY
jgi:hypothetical protein